MRKSEAEPAVRALVRQWAATMSPSELEHPHFTAFRRWMASEGYGHYGDFRSVAGADEDMERWFDQELKQTWRN